MKLILRATVVGLLGTLAGGSLALLENPKLEAKLDDDPKVNRILQQACADCHSPQATLPWYGRMPPASWLVRQDIVSAREHLSIEAGRRLSMNQKEEMVDALAGGFMPPFRYRVLHKQARLTTDDIRTLEEWASRDSRMSRSDRNHR